VRSMRLSDTADSFVFMRQLLRRQYGICLRQHDKDCYQDLVGCHGVLSNSLLTVLIVDAHTLTFLEFRIEYNFLK
jgi:hypothetical protein